MRPRSRQLRFWSVCLVLPALALLPAPASAQAPPGEQAPTGDQIRAQARAFGDAALALETERKRLQPRFVRALGKSEGSSRCLLELEGAKGGFDAVGPFIFLADILPPATRVFSPAVDRFVDRLDAAGPGEPILAAGAWGWRKTATVWAERRLLQLGVKSRAARAFNADLLFGDAFFGGGSSGSGSAQDITSVGVSPVF